MGHLLAGDLVDDETLLRGLLALREETAELGRLLGEAEAVAVTLPHRERNLLLVHPLDRKLIAAHEEWLDEIEAALRPQKNAASRTTPTRETG